MFSVHCHEVIGHEGSAAVPTAPSNVDTVRGIRARTQIHKKCERRELSDRGTREEMQSATYNADFTALKDFLTRSTLTLISSIPA